MAEFQAAFVFLLPHEGGLVDDPLDPGGVTKYGISKISYPDVDVANLTVDEAGDIYRRDWWDKYHYDYIVSQKIANKVLDLAVNMGASQAHRIVQLACGDSGFATTADGQFGPNTLAAVNACNPDTLLDYIRQRARSYYLNLVERRPSSAKFLNGWINRANA